MPDPVYAPASGLRHRRSNTNLATGLVKGLLEDQGSWLSAARRRPRSRAGTTLIGTRSRSAARLRSSTWAAGPGLDAEHAVRQIWPRSCWHTLTTGAYSAPVAHSVAARDRWQIGLYRYSRAVQPDRSGGNAVQLEPVYFQSGPYSVSEVPSATSAEPAAGPAQIGQSAITADRHGPPGTQHWPAAAGDRDRDGRGVRGVCRRQPQLLAYHGYPYPVQAVRAHP